MIPAVALLVALAAPAPRPPAAVPRGWTVERAVVLIRHGVRPPTKAIPLPPEFVADAWPAWPVPPGHLTPHGAEAIRLSGAHDRAQFVASGLLPAQGCPAPGALDVYADSDQRTIRTGEAYVEALAPGCAVRVAHRPEGEDDPVFQPIASGAVAYAPARARAAVLAAGDPVKRAAGVASLLRRLDRIYVPACARPACRLSALPTALAPPRAGAKPKLEGGLDLGSTAAHILLLEYADGRPLSEVGWGRATAADVTALSRLHALEFDLLARPRYVAARNLALIAPRILAGLFAPDAAKLTVIVGHDTNVASLGGLLGLHWRAPGYAADDPPPGGAIRLELLRDAWGRRAVRAVFEAQSLEQLRTLVPPDAARPPYMADMPVAGCPAPCAPARFRRLMAVPVATPASP